MDIADQTVVFVCPHGAGKSRIAAAWFNHAAPRGWRATTAGISPQATVSAHAVRLLAGTPAAEQLDEQQPRPVSAVAMPSLLVAIDCAADDIDADLRWRLDSGGFDDAMSAELRARASDLAQRLAAQQ